MVEPVTFEPIHHDEIDGVPVHWADLPGPTTASLIFRVGRSDEAPARYGITHLVEHLALAPLGVQDYDHNGFVEALRTSFHISGGPEDVTSFISGISATFGELPTDRLLLERAILRREADEAGGSLGDALRADRFGGMGLGASANEEFGLRWLGPDVVREWARSRFVAQAAILVLSGPPPAGLRLDLPSGERMPVVAPSRGPDLVLPAHTAWPMPGVAMTLLLPRRPGSNMVMGILHRRLRSRLRFELGAVYDIHFDYDRIDAETAHVAYATDCDEREVDRVQNVMIQILDDLAANGPTADELASEVSGLLRDWQHPEARAAFIYENAFDALLGQPKLEPEALVQERRAIRPEDAAAILTEALPSLMVFAAAPNPLTARLHDTPEWSQDEVTGETSNPAGRHLPGRGPRERLIVGPDGVTLRVGDGQRVTVRYRDLLVAVHDHGTRSLHGRDGVRITVDPKAWRDGPAVVARIDAAVPADAVVCAGHAAGALADPEGRT